MQALSGNSRYISAIIVWFIVSIIGVLARRLLDLGSSIV